MKKIISLVLISSFIILNSFASGKSDIIIEPNSFDEATEEQSEETKKALKDAGEVVGKTAKKAVDASKKIGKEIGEGAKVFGKSVKDAFKEDGN